MGEKMKISLFVLVAAVFVLQAAASTALPVHPGRAAFVNDSPFASKVDYTPEEQQQIANCEKSCYATKDVCDDQSAKADAARRLKLDHDCVNSGEGSERNTRECGEVRAAWSKDWNRCESTLQSCRQACWKK